MATENTYSLPKNLPTQQVLWFHWLRSSERLKALLGKAENHQALNLDTPHSTESLRQAYATIHGFELLDSRMKRILTYLNHSGSGRSQDSLTPLDAAGLIRKNFQRGDSDAAVALFLEQWRTPAKKLGRPVGSSDAENVAVLALDLHDGDPKTWPWARIADSFLKCKSHSKHNSDDECVARLKKSVARLRAFLEKLQSDEP